MKLISSPELSLKQGHIYHSYYDVLVGTAKEILHKRVHERARARVCVCVCVCGRTHARTRTCLRECNINTESANLEWNFHDNRVNKVNRLLKYNAKKCVKKKEHNILKTQHLQRSLYITTLTIFLLLQLHPFPIIQETKTFRYMLRIATVSVQQHH
jgi:hypothetical protein